LILDGFQHAQGLDVPSLGRKGINPVFRFLDG